MNPQLACIFLDFRLCRKTGTQSRLLHPFHAPGRQSGGPIWPFSLAFGRTPPSVAFERMTIGRLTLVPVADAAVVPR